MPKVRLMAGVEINFGSAQFSTGSDVAKRNFSKDVEIDYDCLKVAKSFIDGQWAFTNDLVYDVKEKVFLAYKEVKITRRQMSTDTKDAIKKLGEETINGLLKLGFVEVEDKEENNAEPTD